MACSVPWSVCQTLDGYSLAFIELKMLHQRESKISYVVMMNGKGGNWKNMQINWNYFNWRKESVK